MGASSESATNALIPKGNMSQSGIEYISKLRDVKYYETIFDLLARQYEVAKVDEAREGSMVQIVDLAVVPDRRSSPVRSLIVLGSIGFRHLPRHWLGICVRGHDQAFKQPAERWLDALKQLSDCRRARSEAEATMHTGVTR